VLSTIHRLVHDAGGIRDALALEATCKALNSLYYDETRFHTELILEGAALARGAPVANSFWHWVAKHGRRVVRLPLLRGTAMSDDTPVAQSFWRWIAKHGHRVRCLTFDGIDLEQLPLRNALREHAGGIAAARMVKVRCTSAASFEALAGLRNLTELDTSTRWVSDTGQQGTAIDLRPLASLPALWVLKLGHPFSNATVLTSLTALDFLDLHCSSTTMTTLDILASAAPPPLLSLRLAGGRSVTSLDAISCLTALKRLALHEFPALHDLAPLSALQELRCLDLERVHGLHEDSLLPLASLTSLSTLVVHRCAFPSIRPLAALALSLLDLAMHLPTGPGAAAVPMGATVSELTALTQLVIWFAEADSSLACLAPLTNLQRLTCIPSTLVDNLEPLASLVHLTHLYLDAQAYNVSSLAPISRLTMLRRLMLHSQGGVSSLQPLAALTGLQFLALDSCLSVSDASPLNALTRLTRLYLTNSPLLDQSTLRHSLLGALRVDSGCAPGSAIVEFMRS
jgi:hypothetical protein